MNRLCSYPSGNEPTHVHSRFYLLPLWSLQLPPYEIKCPQIYSHLSRCVCNIYICSSLKAISNTGLGAVENVCDAHVGESADSASLLLMYRKSVILEAGGAVLISESTCSLFIMNILFPPASPSLAWVMAHSTPKAFEMLAWLRVLLVMMVKMPPLPPPPPPTMMMMMMMWRRRRRRRWQKNTNWLQSWQHHHWIGLRHADHSDKSF